jgi:hypothetical protein
MRKFTSPTQSPEGFSGGRAQHLRDVVANAYTAIAILAEASRRMEPAPAEDAMEDRYDDGLVHDHGWARSH